MEKKLRGQGGITKLICELRADWFKKQFRKKISNLKPIQFSESNNLKFDMISFSGASSFEDQLLSIYSFVYYGGVPIKWTIYSDKSYSDEHKKIFKRIFPFVSVLDWDVYNNFEKSKQIKDYLRVSVLAKKINIILGHPHNQQTVYVDSDVVFYRNISYYLNANLLNRGFWFVTDTLGDLDVYFSKEPGTIYPLNSGLLILNKDFDNSDVLKYLEELNGDYGYFSEQSSFEYAFKNQGANMLDPRQFIIDSSDQFDFGTKYHPCEVAMRHYTSPIRHKMWQHGWSWHFPSQSR